MRMSLYAFSSELYQIYSSSSSKLMGHKVLQSTAPGDINDDLMELLIMIRACKDASARRIVSFDRHHDVNCQAETP